MRVGMSGHQDIPQEAITYVKNGIVGVVSELTDDLIGVSSLAAGADQIFASVILEHYGRLHVIIPCRGYETTFSEKDDIDRFRLLIDKASKVDNLDYPEPSEDAYLAAGHHVVDNSDILVAVWDGRPAKGRGGTADVVNYARSHGREVKVIWPSGVTR